MMGILEGSSLYIGSDDNITFSGDNGSQRCYVDGNVYNCVRISILVTLGMITGAFCLARVIQYHCYKARNYHQYFVYYMAVLVCLLSIIHWSYVTSPVLDLLMTFLIVVQMLTMSWFFCSWAFRILQQEKLFNYVIIPCLVGALLYYLACLIWAAVDMHDIAKECTAPQWLLFTSSQLVHVQIFLISVIYITKKLNVIRTMKTNRFSQKAQLWGLAIMYEVVSITAFAYDLYFLFTKSVDHRCGTTFRDHPVGGTVLYIVHKVIKYFVPQLTICVIFGPLKSRPPVDREFEETDTLSWAGRPNYQSTFYTSGETSTPNEKEADSLTPYSLNGPINSQTAPILPRTVPTSSSFHQSPWIQPGRSWMSDNGAAAVTSPSSTHKKPAH